MWRVWFVSVAAVDDVDHLEVDDGEAPELVGRKFRMNRVERVGSVAYSVVSVFIVCSRLYSGMNFQPGRRRALWRNMWCRRILIQCSGEADLRNVPFEVASVLGVAVVVRDDREDGHGCSGSGERIGAGGDSAAPISAIEARVGSVAPSIMSTMLRATALAIIAEGIPVRGGAGAITVPFGLVRGTEIGCGGANAIPAANTFW